MAQSHLWLIRKNENEQNSRLRSEYQQGIRSVIGGEQETRQGMVSCGASSGISDINEYRDSNHERVRSDRGIIAA